MTPRGSGGNEGFCVDQPRCPQPASLEDGGQDPSWSETYTKSWGWRAG